MTDADPRAQIVSLLPRLRRFACGLTHDPPLADDLVQTACLKALERWHQYQADTSLASWMFRIVQTTWLDDYRKRARHKTDTDTDALPDLEGEDGRQVGQWPQRHHIQPALLQGQPQGGLRGLEQPGLGFAQAAPGEPVARHQRGRQPFIGIEIEQPGMPALLLGKALLLLTLLGLAGR